MREVLLSCVLVAASAQAVAGQEIRVRPVPRDGRVYVSFSMTEAFSEDVREAIGSGLETSFSYDVELRRGGPLWFARTIAAIVLTATVRYDNLTRRYHVTRAQDGRVEGSEVFDSEDAVRRWLTTFERLPLFSTERLEANAEYSLRVRARTTPRRAWLPWPFGQHVAAGLAKFTFIP
jgi:hypothetical protein